MRNFTVSERNQLIFCSKILLPPSSVSMFSVVTDIDVNNLRAVLRGLRHKGLSWEILISFLRFPRHHDRDWPCHTGYFRSLPLPSSPWIPPKLLGSFLFCGSRPRPAWTRIDFVPCSSRVARPRSASSETAWRNPITIRALRVGRAVFFRFLFPSYRFKTSSTLFL